MDNSSEKFFIPYKDKLLQITNIYFKKVSDKDLAKEIGCSIENLPYALWSFGSINILEIGDDPENINLPVDCEPLFMIACCYIISKKSNFPRRRSYKETWDEMLKLDLDPLEQLCTHNHKNFSYISNLALVDV